MNATCLACHFQKQVETAVKLGSEEAATAFARELMASYLSAPENTAAPYFGPITDALFQKHFGLPEDRYAEEKRLSNEFVLTRMDAVRSRIEAQTDPVYAGLQFSILGNYLDFSALQGRISFEELEDMLELGLQMELDRDCYRRLCADLEKAEKLLYLTDNAGEIGFDRLFAEQIQKQYPHLSITFCVRGGPAMNDATKEDAAIVGVPFPVIDNGRNYAGTVLSALGTEAREAIDSADVILSKGMGNVETLLGCGLNIYYAFLVKCAHFMRLFDRPLMTPMLVSERTRNGQSSKST